MCPFVRGCTRGCFGSALWVLLLWTWGGRLGTWVLSPSAESRSPHPQAPCPCALPVEQPPHFCLCLVPWSPGQCHLHAPRPPAVPLLCHSSNPPVPASGAFAGAVLGAGMTSDCTHETPRRGSTGGSIVLCPDTRATLSPAASPSWLGFPRTSSSIRLNDLFLLFLSFLWGWFQFTPCCVLGWCSGAQRALVVVGWGVVCGPMQMSALPGMALVGIPLASSLALRGHPR